MIMNIKFFGLILFLLMISSFVFSESISDYVVSSSVPLSTQITATGVYVPDANESAENVLCSFYVLNSGTGALMGRATSQYTTGTGRFALLNYYANEPTFKRGYCYTLRSECGAVSVDSNFCVTQRESIAHVGAQEFAFFTEPENTDTGFIWGALIVILLIALLTILYFYKVVRA